jgi:DNA modification methylase
LIEPLIRLTSDEGDVVFDPFLGTGTTVIVANRLNRIGMGCELNGDFLREELEEVKE